MCLIVTLQKLSRMLPTALFFCGLAGMAGATCTTSAKLAMSRGFLPAAMTAVGSLGFGKCPQTNNTCLTPPSNCPETSCCLKGLRSGSCGCSEEGEGLGPEWGDTICTDPKAFRFAVNTCDDRGARHFTELQLYAVPPFQDCQEGVTVEVDKENGSFHLNVKFSLCKSRMTKVKGYRGGDCSLSGMGCITLSTDISGTVHYHTSL